ncbi:hypothetical protein [Anaerosacchariphilus polymeriproducens]|uniref:Uncharacterized protein n=1 Tax=Anaerosacchariphilus polymeriproducens TaxID=1812858 RepID=A0A371B045_9FIRM|nr:hypothetical protein [Anaerosacchariphilus polymeriproducens]RDU25176.1 hypothetical protein DWV06_00570 [Anaerosacchariphilus polymeriproducens]
MLKRKKLCRLAVFVMTILMITSQLRTLAYAKDETKNSNTQQNQNLENTNDSISNLKQQISPKDIILILENYNLNNKLRKDYKWTIVTNFIVGNFYCLNTTPNQKYGYDRIMIQKEKESGKLYFTVRGYKVYLDKYLSDGHVIYNEPKSTDFISMFEEEKEAAINFIQSLKETSPNSNVYILANPKANENSVIQLTEGFENVSKNSEQIVNEIHNLNKVSGCLYERSLTLKETYNLLDKDASLITNGRDKQVILCSGLADQNENFDEAQKYADLLKNNLHIVINIINIKESGGTYSNLIPNSLASENLSNTSEKKFYVTDDNLWVGDIFQVVFKDIFGL